MYLLLPAANWFKCAECVNRGSILYGGPNQCGTLNEDDYLESDNGIYFAYLQDDQDFVIYKVSIRNNLSKPKCIKVYFSMKLGDCKIHKTEIKNK